MVPSAARRVRWSPSYGTVTSRDLRPPCSPASPPRCSAKARGRRVGWFTGRDKEPASFPPGAARPRDPAVAYAAAALRRGPPPARPSARSRRFARSTLDALPALVISTARGGLDSNSSLRLRHRSRARELLRRRGGDELPAIGEGRRPLVPGGRRLRRGIRGSAAGIFARFTQD